MNCESGKYSSISSSKCTECARGKGSDTGSASCEKGFKASDHNFVTEDSEEIRSSISKPKSDSKGSSSSSFDRFMIIIVFMMLGCCYYKFRPDGFNGL